MLSWRCKWSFDYSNTSTTFTETTAEEIINKGCENIYKRFTIENVNKRNYKAFYNGKMVNVLNFEKYLLQWKQVKIKHWNYLQKYFHATIGCKKVHVWNLKLKIFYWLQLKRNLLLSGFLVIDRYSREFIDVHIYIYKRELIYSINENCFCTLLMRENFTLPATEVAICITKINYQKFCKYKYTICSNFVKNLKKKENSKFHFRA